MSIPISYKVALSLNKAIGRSIVITSNKLENSPMNVNDSEVISSHNFPSLLKNKKNVSLVKL